MTMGKQLFDEKFSREFFIKQPFLFYQNTIFSITCYVSVVYKIVLKFAKISPKNILLLKIACMSAEKCQFHGQKIVLTARRL